MRQCSSNQSCVSGKHGLKLVGCRDCRGWRCQYELRVEAELARGCFVFELWTRWTGLRAKLWRSLALTSSHPHKPMTNPQAPSGYLVPTGSRLLTSRCISNPSASLGPALHTHLHWHLCSQMGIAIPVGAPQSLLPRQNPNVQLIALENGEEG